MSQESSSRPTKRERTRARILGNAIALFRQAGVRPTKMSAIAEASGVSPATLFKHFPTKAVLAETWVRGEIDELLDASGLARGDGSLRPLLRRVARGLAARSSLDAQVRLEAWRETGRARGAVESREAREDGLRLRLQQEQESERVRGDLPAARLAEMLREALEGGLIEGLEALVASGTAPPGGPGAAADLLEGCLRTRLDLVLDGSRKRNERVAAPAPARAPMAPPSPEPGRGPESGSGSGSGGGPPGAARLGRPAPGYSPPGVR